MPATPIYAQRTAEVYAALETSPEGLAPEAVSARLALYGPNALREAAPEAAWWQKLFTHATHPMALLLWLAGVAAMVGGRPLLGVVIWGVVIVNGIFSFLQEYRAQQAVTSLRHLLPAQARVIRQDRKVEVSADQVVPGD